MPNLPYTNSAAVLLCLTGACSTGAAPRASLGAPPTEPSVESSNVDLPPNDFERRLGEMIARDPQQRRGSLTRSPILARVARQKAIDMGRRGYFAHVDPDGLGANTLVERAGYRLPANYDHSRGGNNIESLGVGYTTPEAAWRRWMGSQAHRRHLMGQDSQFVRQTEYGIGYASVPGSRRVHYWVVLIAEPRDGP